jgi:hypothetical protein
MSFTYRLHSTGETSPPYATPARMPRHVDVANWKDVWNVRQSRYEDMVFTLPIERIMAYATCLHHDPYLGKQSVLFTKH